jgi:glycopeptide antibiotics resistance protein
LDRFFALALYMPPLSQPLKVLCWIVFIAYLCLLTKNILFKHSPSYYKNYFHREYKHYTVKEGWARANTKPFSTIRLFYNSRQMNTEYKAKNLLGNLAGFLPFGFLLPMLLPWWRNIFKIVFAGAFLSLGYETLQLVFGLGIFDVDDIILNTAGTLAGGILFYMLVLLLRVTRLNAD